MPKTILILLTALTTTLLCFSCSSSKKSKECTQFKTGAFMYHFKMEQDDVYFSVNRNDSIQMEVNQKTGEFSKLAIKWTDNCSYELKLIESTVYYPDSIQEIIKKATLKTEIISSTADYYVFKAKSNNSDLVLTDTLWVRR
jgi:hypothetical protein